MPYFYKITVILFVALFLGVIFTSGDNGSGDMSKWGFFVTSIYLVAFWGPLTISGCRDGNCRGYTAMLLAGFMVIHEYRGAYANTNVRLNVNGTPLINGV